MAILDSASITFRTDRETKDQLTWMAAEFGMNLSTLMNAMAKMTVRRGKLELDATEVPNAETLEALQEADDIMNGRVKAKGYRSFDELWTVIEEEMTEEDSNLSADGVA